MYSRSHSHHPPSTCTSSHTHLQSSQGPEHCNMCRNYYVEEMIGEGPLMRVCVEACPLGTFLNTSSHQCVPCHSACQNGTGCAGPLPYVNRTHGCLECDRVQLDRQGRQVGTSDRLPAPFYTTVIQ